MDKPKSSSEQSSGIGGCCKRAGESRNTLLALAFVAIFLDKSLLTAICPIAPRMLWRMRNRSFNFTAACSSQVANATDASAELARFAARLSAAGVPPGPTSLWLPEEFVSPDAGSTEFANSSAVQACLPLAARWHAAEARDVNLVIGFLFACKAAAQIVCNPFVGPLTNRVGFSVPMTIGFVIMIVSTVVYALSDSVVPLFIARSVQGIGASFTTVSALGALATRFTDEMERGKAIGIAVSGIGLGITIGPVYGGFVYDLAGKQAPFLILAACILLALVMQLMVLRPKVTPEPQEAVPLLELLTDPYILLSAAGIALCTFGFALIDATMPTRMRSTMAATSSQIGLVFVPSAIGYFIFTSFLGCVPFKMGRWRCAIFGMLLTSVCTALLPPCRNFWALIGPIFGIGLGVGIVDVALMPMMAFLTDLRHSPVYGSVYAIGDAAFCCSHFIGPIVTGSLVKAVGFNWMSWIVAICMACFTPLILLLRNPPARDEDRTPLTAMKRSLYGGQTAEQTCENAEGNGEMINMSRESVE